MFLRETGSEHDVYDIALDLFVQINLTDDFTCLQDFVFAQDRFDVRFHSGDILTDNQLFFFFLRIVDDDLQHETVYLCFRQRIGSFLLDRVLGRHNQERRRQFVCVFADCHLAFLHCFQKGALHLCRSTVDFIRQYKISEDWSLFNLEFFAFLTINHRTDHIGRQQVRRELDTAVFRIDQ